MKSTVERIESTLFDVKRGVKDLSRRVKVFEKLFRAQETEEFPNGNSPREISVIEIKFMYNPEPYYYKTLQEFKEGDYAIVFSPKTEQYEKVLVTALCVYPDWNLPAKWALGKFD